MRDIADLDDLVDLAAEEQDSSMQDELSAQVDAIQSRVEETETARLLGEPMDASNAFVSFSPGAGGIDSADWAEMLLRMVSRYCEKKGFKANVVEIQ